MNNIEFIIPEGYELDEQNSTDKKVVYKPKDNVECKPEEKPIIKKGELFWCRAQDYGIFEPVEFIQMMNSKFHCTPSVRRMWPDVSYKFCGCSEIYYTLYRRATPEEKRIFKDIMSENGWEYNEESGTLTKKRWRANRGFRYYWITSRFGIASNIEANRESDNEMYNTGNYFNTQEEAEKYRQKIIDTLTNRE